MDASLMQVRWIRKRSRSAVWSRRLAIFFLQLLILTVLLHRFGSLGTQAALNLLSVSITGLILAFGLGIFGLIRIWRRDDLGAVQAVFGVLLALAGLAPFLWFGGQAAFLPPIDDVATTPANPLPFKDLSMRPADANPIRPLTPSEVKAQEKAYPDVHPLDLERSVTDAFALVRAAMHQLGWHIVVSDPPAPGGVGYLQAIDRTMIMGFTDDVAASVTAKGKDSVLNVRSASRYGRSDIGANAARILALFSQVKSDINEGEKPILERAGTPPPPPVPPHRPRGRRKHGGSAGR